MNSTTPPNILFCLSHFCELHGPSTIICSQFTTPESKSDFKLPSFSRLQTCASCKLILPNDSVNLESTSMATVKGIDKEWAFISNQYPVSEKRYTSLTKLVMKALSVETASDISKPMYFGDTVNGFCLNKVFKIRDVGARGGERKYIFMVVCDIETELLQNWEVISNYFDEMISLLQKKVEEVAERVGKSNSGTDLDNERFLRRSVIKPRSLVELTNDKEIFVKLHLWGIELIKDIMA